jgi:hypothetical protein
LDDAVNAGYHTSALWQNPLPTEARIRVYSVQVYKTSVQPKPVPGKSVCSSSLEVNAEAGLIWPG